MGLDRFSSRTEDGSEVTDRTIWVALSVRNISPLELAAVSARVESDALGSAERVRDLSFENLRVQDVGCLIRRNGNIVVVGVVRNNAKGDGVREDAGSVIGSGWDAEARSEIVDQVVETAETFFNTERGDEIGDTSVVVTNVVADTIFRHQEVRGLGAGYQCVNRATVFTTVGLKAAALTVHTVVDRIKNLVRDVGIRKVILGIGSVKKVDVTTVLGEGNAFEVDQSACRSRVNLASNLGSRRLTGDKVSCDTLKLVAVAVLPSVRENSVISSVMAESCCSRWVANIRSSREILRLMITPGGRLELFGETVGALVVIEGATRLVSAL